MSVPRPEELRIAAAELRAGASIFKQPDPAARWRGRVADFLDVVAGLTPKDCVCPVAGVFVEMRSTCPVHKEEDDW